MGGEGRGLSPVTVAFNVSHSWLRNYSPCYHCRGSFVAQSSPWLHGSGDLHMFSGGGGQLGSQTSTWSPTAAWTMNVNTACCGRRNQTSARPLEVTWTTEVFQGDLIQKTNHSFQIILLFGVSVAVGQCVWGQNLCKIQAATHHPALGTRCSGSTLAQPSHRQHRAVR